MKMCPMSKPNRLTILKSSLPSIALAMSWVAMAAGEDFEKSLGDADALVSLAAARKLVEQADAPSGLVEEIATFADRRDYVRLARPVYFEQVSSLPKNQDSLPLIRLKGSPEKYANTFFYMVGFAAIDDYYNYRYLDAERTHSSFRFTEINEMCEPGETVHLFAPKDFSSGLTDVLIALAEKKLGHVPVRVKCTFSPAGENPWDILTLVDWQFLDETGTGWGASAYEHLDLASRLIDKVPAADSEDIVDAIVTGGHTEPVVESLRRRLFSIDSKPDRAAALKRAKQLVSRSKDKEVKARAIAVAEGLQPKRASARP